MKRKTTYQGMGFDFDSQWAISESKTYPYNIKQSTPPELTSFTSGSASKVMGTADGDGKVYALVDNMLYEGTITDGQWSVSIGTVDANTRVAVSVQTSGKMPSPILVVQKGDGIPTGEPSSDNRLFGDFNGDGILSITDVMLLVNIIMGN
ncbi:MAG: hypothetical protein IKI26_04670 [Prevotella sp.]|nr:hypothetical protein [Prevotella sp.]